jgi:hypothetical protein
MDKLIIQIIGWVAMLMILYAYYLISSEKVDAKNRFFQNLNLFGAILFVINLSYFEAWPSVTLNAIWALIALKALKDIKKARQNGNESDPN